MQALAGQHSSMRNADWKVIIKENNYNLYKSFKIYIKLTQIKIRTQVAKLQALNPVAILARGFYAPEITSFLDSEEVTDFSARFQVEAMPQTIAFIGIRNLEFGIDGKDDYEADDSNIHVGVRLTF